MASLGCFENTDFTKLGFADNLELKEDINRNRLNTLLVCRTETINRRTIVWVMWLIFFNPFGEQTLGKQYREDRYNAGKSQTKKVSCSMCCKCYLTSKRFLKRNHACVVLRKFTRCLLPLEVSHVLALILPMSFCVQQELRQAKDLRQNKWILIILPIQEKWQSNTQPFFPMATLYST